MYGCVIVQGREVKKKFCIWTFLYHDAALCCHYYCSSLKQLFQFIRMCITVFTFIFFLTVRSYVCITFKKILLNIDKNDLFILLCFLYFYWQESWYFGYSPTDFEFFIPPGQNPWSCPQNYILRVWWDVKLLTHRYLKILAGRRVSQCRMLTGSLASISLTIDSTRHKVIIKTN